MGGVRSILEGLLMDSYAFWKSGRIDRLNSWPFRVVENRDRVEVYRPNLVGLVSVQTTCGFTCWRTLILDNKVFGVFRS